MQKFEERLKQKADEVAELERTCGLSVTDGLGVNITEALIQTIVDVAVAEHKKATEDLQKRLDLATDALLNFDSYVKEQKKKLDKLCNELIWCERDDLQYVNASGEFDDRKKLDDFIKAKQESIRKKFEELLK